MATKKQEVENEVAPDIVIITGLSGSGMSSATNAFEDLGYFCVDNLPLTMLPTFARLVQPSEDGRGRIERAALVINIREGEFLAEFDKELQRLRERGLRVFVLFLEASDEVLQRRIVFEKRDGLVGKMQNGDAHRRNAHGRSLSHGPEHRSPAP